MFGEAPSVAVKIQFRGFNQVCGVLSDDADGTRPRWDCLIRRQNNETFE